MFGVSLEAAQDGLGSRAPTGGFRDGSRRGPSAAYVLDTTVKPEAQYMRTMARVIVVYTVLVGSGLLVPPWGAAVGDTLVTQGGRRWEGKVTEVDVSVDSVCH